jgi:two-component system chemotaxis response regulator CheY
VAQLEKLGSVVEAVSSSSEALLKILRWYPDLIISGVEVGDINGYDLCMLLRLMPDFAGVPVIIISSGNADAVKFRAADAGADYYVKKDEQLLANLSEAVNKVLYSDGSRTVESSAVVSPIRRVLLVDDSRIMRRIIRNILHNIGVEEILEAEHGAAALERLARIPVDLVITDWNMPVMDGLTLIREIRRDPRLASLRVVMVTTEGSRDAMARSKEAGANDHLRKPFSVESMKAMIGRLTAG